MAQDDWIKIYLSPFLTILQALSSKTPADRSTGVFFRPDIARLVVLINQFEMPDDY